jgi:hypothetical protein
MLSVTSATRVLVATTPVDLRGSYQPALQSGHRATQRRSLVRALVRVHQQATESDQGALLGWRWFMGLCQTIGTGTIHNYGGRAVELNFNQSVLFDFGMSYSF